MRNFVVAGSDELEFFCGFEFSGESEEELGCSWELHEFELPD